MSERRKKGKPESRKPESQKAEPKEARIVPAKPKGTVPSAEVSSRHDAMMIQRPGKGFSLGELAAASLPLRLAAQWGVSTDSRRRTVLEPNVRTLKGWYTPPRPSSEPAQPRAAPKEAPAKKRAVRKKKTPE